MKELSVVNDSRQPRNFDQVVAEQLVPHRLHWTDLGEEAMAADVEPEFAVAGCSGNTSDNIICLEYSYVVSGLGELIRRGETRWPRSDDDNGFSALAGTRKRYCVL